MPAETATCLSALELLRALYHRETSTDDWTALMHSIPKRTSFRPSSLDQNLDDPEYNATPGNGD